MMRAFPTLLMTLCVLVAASGCSSPGIPQNHRASLAACLAPAPAGNYACASDCNVAGVAPSCMSDADCTLGVQGRCVKAQTAAGPPAYCAYDSCVDDSNCLAKQTCACHGSTYWGHLGSQCMPSDCSVDGDCGAGGYCSPSPSTTLCESNLYGYYCHTPKDTCTNDSDCDSGGICAFDIVLLLWDCTGPTHMCQ